jgi:uncharacterized protein (DUF2236 family)
MQEAGKRVSAKDQERLQYAVGGKPVDLDRSLLGPQSVTWRVNREAVLLAGGGCALLLQVAHPLVAAGVAEHSNFRERPLDRLYRTLDLMLRITFAPARDAIRAVREIERRHARVRGRLRDTAGPFPKGTPYDANDPHLMLWVHATLVDTALRVFEMFLRPLTEEERDRYYQESTIVARILGIPNDLVPKTRVQFERYYRHMLASDSLAVSNESREIAAAILNPTQPLWLRGVMPPVRLLTTGLLPEPLRQRYGLSWPTWEEQVFRVAVLATQLAIPWLPSAVRFFPHAREAWRREATSTLRGTPAASRAAVV